MAKKKAQLKDKVIEAANRVWRAFLKFGPVDDGRPEGDEFDTALMELRIASKVSYRRTTDERAALVNIVNAADQIKATGGELPSKALADAIDFARKTCQESDLYVEALEADAGSAEGE